MVFLKCRKLQEEFCITLECITRCRISYTARVRGQRSQLGMRKVESEITKDISLSRQEDGKYQDGENIQI